MTACQNGRSLIVRELMRCKQINPNVSDSQKKTALWLADKKGLTSSFLSILCTPHLVIETTTKPDGNEYPKNTRVILWSMLLTVSSSGRSMAALSQMNIHFQANSFSLSFSFFSFFLLNNDFFVCFSLF